MIAPGDVRPSHPAPNVRDDREPPLLWVRDRRKEATDLGSHKAKYFFRRDWTTQIRLKHLTKSRFTRGPFAVVQVVRTAQSPRKCPSSGKSGSHALALN